MRRTKQDWVFKLIYLLGCLDVAAVAIVGTINVCCWAYNVILALLSMCNGIGIVAAITAIAAFGVWLVRL